MPDKLGQAIAAIRAGDKSTGRRLLIEVVQSEPRNETAWLWMAGLVENETSYARCLENVLKINPNNEMARQSLAALLANAPALNDDPSFAAALKPQSMSHPSFESLSLAASSGSRMAGTIVGGTLGLILGSLVLGWFLRPATVVLVSIILGSIGMFVGWMVGAGGPAKSLLITIQSGGCLPATISGGAAGLVLTYFTGSSLVGNMGEWSVLLCLILPIIAAATIVYYAGRVTTEKIVMGCAGIVLVGVVLLALGNIGGIIAMAAMAVILLLGSIIGGAKIGTKLIVWLAGVIEAMIGSELRA
jgi:hypothetical protein